MACSVYFRNGRFKCLLSLSVQQIDAAVQLEQQGGLDIIAINALVAALASGDRLVEAEDYLKKAVDLSHNKGTPPHH